MTGVLAGIEDEAGADLRGVEAFVGTSAGAIVAARLAAGKPLRRPREPGRAADRRGRARRRRRGVLRTAARWGWAATSPLAPVATALSAPGRSARCARPCWRASPDSGRTLGAPARRDRALGRALRRAPAGLLRRPALGRRVVFGAPGAPARRVADAVSGLVRDPVGLRPGADRRARVRRRRRVERDEPRRRPRPPRDRGAVPGPDRIAALAAAPGLPRGHLGRAADPAPARRAGAPRRPGRGGGARRWGPTSWPRSRPPRRWRPATAGPLALRAAG